MEDFGVQKHSWQIISQVLFPKLIRKIICYLAVIWLLHLLALLVCSSAQCFFSILHKESGSNYDLSMALKTSNKKSNCFISIV